jgi:predicted DNA-binding WGR domain protein
MSFAWPLLSSANGRYSASGAAAGRRGTVRQTSFAHYDDAEKAERQIIKRRLNHGYTDRAAWSKRPEHSGNNAAK